MSTDPRSDAIARRKRPGTWPQAVHEYATTMRAANRAHLTIRLHRHYLNQLMDLAQTPWSITPLQLEALSGNPHWGPEARKSARTVYRGFYGWALARGYVDANPALTLPAVKVPETLPRPAPEAVVSAAVTTLDPRMRCMVQLAAFCGLRVKEIAVVHASDVFDDMLLVHGKGGKQRFVPLEEPKLRGRLQLLEGYAFPNRWTGEPITAGHVSRMMSAALPGGWTAHNLRHRLATQAYAGSGDVLAVMRLLGHSRPETTMRYVQLVDDKVRAAARAALLEAS